jgi:hypothetical protein
LTGRLATHPPLLFKGREKEESKRGEASLNKSFPLPLIKGKGDKGGWGRIINSESVKS